jgi:hypothetical protein
MRSVRAIAGSARCQRDGRDSGIRDRGSGTCDRRAELQFGLMARLKSRPTYEFMARLKSRPTYEFTV